MANRFQAAANILEALGWTYDGKDWQEPKDRWGAPSSAIVDAMADILTQQFNTHIERADVDVYSQAVVDQLGPLMTSWQQVRPKIGFE